MHHLPSFIAVASPAHVDESPGIERLLALTDAVVAIALTLLVLQLRVPATRALDMHPDSASSLWHALNVDGSAFMSYLIAFVVIAQFWLVHHRVLRRMRGHNEGLAWRNFGFLLALTLMPFTSNLLGRYETNPVAVTLFAVNLLILSISVQWIFHYAAHHQLMTDQDDSVHERRASQARSAMVSAIAALAILLAWTDVGLSNFVWVLFVLVPFASARVTGMIERVRGIGEAEVAA